jgi:peptidyl-dipeptidase Dcp
MHNELIPSRISPPFGDVKQCIFAVWRFSFYTLPALCYLWNMKKTNSEHPLLTTSTLPHQAIPFDRVHTGDFLPALREAIQRGHQRIAEIKANPIKANFQNTVEALETGSEWVERVAGIYFNLLSAEASEEHQNLAQEFSPVLASFSSDVSLDLDLFERLKVVYENQDQEKLTPEQTRLLEKMYRDFVRGGALLDDLKKARLREVDQELAKLSPQFSENVLKATNAFELIIRDAQLLKGLPASAVEAAKATAEEKGQAQAWLFNLQAPSYVPFITYAESRESREKLWKGYNSRAFGGSFDNQDVILKTVRLRHERAQLLGYQSHAHYVLEERMAETPERVHKFLDDLLDASKAAALRDFNEVAEFARDHGGPETLSPWDFTYYSEKLQEHKFGIDQELLRPYFQLEKVAEGAFEHARRLYDLQFVETHDVPVYHPDVKAYEVRKATTGTFIGLFYTDFFPRETKKSGAWMTTFREQGLLAGDVVRPHVSIVCNFTKPTATKPSLLTFDEVQTLFHEFGHSLHALLSNVRYRSLSGTSVFWDFVELPSQVMENWVLEKESLDLFARHYQTGEKIPAELAQKLKDSARFLAGYTSLRQINFGLLDMAWHATDPDKIRKVDEFEAQVTAKSTVLPRVPGTNLSCGFSHIFAGGYSAGYYSYKWAEVLDADAFEFFQERGIFNREVAKRFEENILSKGGTEHPMELYKRFRGREPDPQALLRRDGLVV